MLVIAGPTAEFPMGIPIALEWPAAILADQSIIGPAINLFRMTVPVIHPTAERTELLFVAALLYNGFSAL